MGGAGASISRSAWQIPRLARKDKRRADPDPRRFGERRRLVQPSRHQEDEGQRGRMPRAAARTWRGGRRSAVSGALTVPAAMRWAIASAAARVPARL